MRSCDTRQQLVQRPVDDRRRERRDHRRRHPADEQLGRPARADRQQLHPGQAPGLRVERPELRRRDGRPGSVSEESAKGDCDADNDNSRAVNGNGSHQNLTIDAALLAIDHSFIVDHYDCGGSLGTLTVNGAISQKFRGAVGTTGGTGYIKDYNYDDRLRYQEPPHFFDPVQSAWHVQRETLG